jgi:hypothetical protein
MNPKKVLLVAVLLLIVVAIARRGRDPIEESAVPVTPVEEMPVEQVEPPAEEEDVASVPEPAPEPVPEAVEPEAAPLPVIALPPRADTLEAWLAQGEPEGAKDREIWIGRGLVLARERRTQMSQWIQEDPERAIQEALTPRMFAALPPEIQEVVERPVAKEGFYGVLAICSHGPDEEHIGSCEIRHEVLFGFGTFEAEAYQAHIYGARQEKMTVEQASLFGVILDDQIALHEHDVVIVDDGEGAEGGRFAVYYRGRSYYADTLEEAERIRDSFM